MRRIGTYGSEVKSKFNYSSVASTKKKKMTYKDFPNKMGYWGTDLISSTPLQQKQEELNLLGNPLSVSIVQWRKSEKQNFLKESENALQ